MDHQIYLVLWLTVKKDEYIVATGRNNQLPLLGSLYRAARHRRPAYQKPNQDVCFPTGTFQNRDTSLLDEWTWQQPELFNIHYWVPGERCSFPAGISWSNPSKRASMKKAKPFSLWNLILNTNPKSNWRQSSEENGLYLHFNKNSSCPQQNEHHKISSSHFFKDFILLADQESQLVKPMC